MGASITVVLTSSNTSLAHHCNGQEKDLSIVNGTVGDGTEGDAQVDARR